MAAAFRVCLVLIASASGASAAARDGAETAAACGGYPWLFCFIIPICGIVLGRIVAYLILAEHGGRKGKLAMAAALLLGLVQIASRATVAGDEEEAASGGYPWLTLRCCIIPGCAGTCVLVLIRIVGNLFWPESGKW